MNGPALGRRLQFHSKKVAQNSPVNGTLEGRKPIQVKQGRLDPGIPAEFPRILINIDGRGTLSQPTPEICLGLSIKTRALAPPPPDVRRKKIVVPIPGLKDLISRGRKTNFFLNLTE
tara:strand:- start:2200 stop:2550 length:351 start_codon:yes stop_codon:yes gene_type:complete